ncbi:hypothetical protein Drose_15315 [Dactylosporangium roseum]|uniref:Uncharacterized protein n=1 Tax=Dactylosporangium roseum TaxID=47989 RepID=A0ABY5ZD30_9ACTN|nr:hypothetical protein [Dactylosporangium roseum]UWZ39481.1 hypothetical protein Drose_15315 [Dactylosporangium roseum]
MLLRPAAVVVVLAGVLSVGWHLGWQVLGLCVAAVAMPHILWATCSPTRRVLLLGSAGYLLAALGLWTVLPGGPGDRTPAIALPLLMPFALAGFAAVAVLVVRRGGSAARAGLVGAGLVVLAVAGGAVLSVVGGSVPAPAAAELLPLPAPLTLVYDSGEDCGATGAVCSREFVVGGPAGVGAAEVARLVRVHLEAHRGWHLDGAGDEHCTAIHWVNLTSRADACVALSDGDGAARVLLNFVARDRA